MMLIMMMTLAVTHNLIYFFPKRQSALYSDVLIDKNTRRTQLLKQTCIYTQTTEHYCDGSAVGYCGRSN